MSAKFKKLENDLITEFKNNPIYHTQALCFINRNVTGNKSNYDIPTLMTNLSAKLASEDGVMSHLRDCFSLMADTDDKFNRYLEYFKDIPSNIPIPECNESGTFGAPGEMDETMKYEIVFLIEKRMPSERIEEFAISGLRMEPTEYKNLTKGMEPNEKLREVFYFWYQKAPYYEYCDKQNLLPKFTNRGLKEALNKCGLSAEMGELK